MGKSGHKANRQILGVISVARAERMLREWVNTDLTGITEYGPAWERLFRLYPEIPSVPTDNIIPVSEDNPKGDFDRFHQQMEMASAVAQGLRDAWDAPDLRHFDWYTWKAQTEYEYEAACARHNVTPSHVMAEDSDKQQAATIAALIEADEPPAVITPVEAAIFYLRHNRDRALHCPNPECPEPYFFRTKKGQKFCSPECAKPSQRESKRQWWTTNRAKERNS
jgi:hypothetical protein